MVTIRSRIHFGLDLLSAGYFTHILIPWHDYVFHEQYMDNFTVNIPEMLTHARVISTRPLFPLLPRPGYEASFNVDHKLRPCKHLVLAHHISCSVYGPMEHVHVVVSSVKSMRLYIRKSCSKDLGGNSTKFVTAKISPSK